MAEAFAAIAANVGAPVEIPFPSSPFHAAPPGRPNMTSLPTLHDGSLPGRPGSSVDLLPPAGTLPPPMYPTASGPPPSPDMGPPPSSALGPTGGPVIHTAPPPPPHRSPTRLWSVAGGVLGACALGTAMIAILGRAHGAAVHPAAGPPSAAAPPASATTPGVTPPAPAPSAAPAGPTATAEVDPAAEASATASAAPAGAPRPPGKGSTLKKKPSWGF